MECQKKVWNVVEYSQIGSTKVGKGVVQHVICLVLYGDGNLQEGRNKNVKNMHETKHSHETND